MNERRFVGPCVGEGGWERVVVNDLGDAKDWGDVIGCWCDGTVSPVSVGATMVGGGRTAGIVGGDGERGGGILRRGIETPAGEVATRNPRGLGLRLRKLPIGLANPLLGLWARIESNAAEDAGATTATWSSMDTSFRRDAALSSTEGTECSICSVAFDLQTLLCWWGSMSRSKMAEDDECLKACQRGSQEQHFTQSTYTEVGDEGMEFGEREPRRWWTLGERWAERWVAEVTWRRSTGLSMVVQQQQHFVTWPNIPDPSLLSQQPCPSFDHFHGHLHLTSLQSNFLGNPS